MVINDQKPTKRKKWLKNSNQNQQKYQEKNHFDQTQAVLMRETMFIVGDLWIRIMIIIFKFHPKLHNHPQLSRWTLESVRVCPWTRFTADSETLSQETTESAHGAKIYSRH